MTPEETLAFARSPAGEAAARAFLSRALHLDAMISVKLSRLDTLREKARRIRSALTGMPAPTGKKDRVGEDSAEIVDLEEEILRDYHALLNQQEEIGRAVGRVPDPVQKAVLELRYLQALPFFRIAMELHYDERQIYRIHKKALGHIALQIASGEAKG